jgi:hypothetical protein
VRLSLRRPYTVRRGVWGNVIGVICDMSAWDAHDSRRC